MARMEIFPVEDAFVMEDAIAKVTDFKPPFVELGLVLLRGGSVWKCVLGKIRPDTGTGVVIVEEAGPKSESQFSHNAPRRERLPAFSQCLFRFQHLVLLPGCESDLRRIIPSIRAAPCRKAPMHRITQGDFRELQSRVEGFAQGHVQQVSGQRDGVIRPVLPVSVDALCMENTLNMLEKGWIHKLGMRLCAAREIV